MKKTNSIKKNLKKYKEIIRIIAIIPGAALIPVMPINLILLTIQITCFGLMFYLGWEF